MIDLTPLYEGMMPALIEKREGQGQRERPTEPFITCHQCTSDRRGGPNCCWRLGRYVYFRRQHASRT